MKFYRDKKKIEFSVGLFTIVALLILIFCYGWLSELLSGTNFQTVKVYFDNAGNLENGDAVTVLGVKRGRVKNIEFHDNKVLFELLISSEVKLKEDAAFEIMESNIMGDVQIEVNPGRNKEYLDLELIHAGNLRYSFSSLLSEFSELTGDLKTLINADGSGGSLLSDLASLTNTAGSLIGKMNDSYDKNTVKIDVVIGNLAQISENLNSIIIENREKMKLTLDTTEKSVSHMDSTLVKLDQLVENINSITEKIGSEKGTLGRLIEDPELYDNLIRVSESADSLLKDIKENPKRYFKVKIF